MPPTANVALLLYWNQVVYQQNQQCGVWAFEGSQQVATTYPSGAPDPLAVSLECPVAVIPGVASFYDVNGNQWSLKNQQVYMNGEVSSSTANVVMLFDYNNVVYHQNSYCGVWQASNTSAGAAGIKWSLSQIPAGAIYEIPYSILETCPGMGGIWTAQIYNSDQTTGTALALTSIDPEYDQFFYTSTNEGCTNQGIGNFNPIAPTLGQTDGEFNLTGNNDFVYCAQLNHGSVAITGELYPGTSMQFSDTAASYYWTMDGLYTYPQQTELYFQNSQLSDLKGTWLNFDGGIWSIDENGVITMSNVPESSNLGTCPATITGQITLMTPISANSDIGAYNMYTFDIECISVKTDGRSLYFKGLLYIDNSVSPKQLIGGGGSGGFDAPDAPTLVQATLQ